MKTITRLALAAILAAFAVPALAAPNGTTTGNMTVTATVAPKCLFISAAPLNFTTTYDASAKVTGSTSFTFYCTKSTAWYVNLNTGANAANAVGTTRAMANGTTDYLSYELYTDAGDTNVWSPTATSGATVASGTGTGGTGAGLTANSVNVYGAIPAGEYVTPGSYTDTVLVTVNY